MNLYQYSMAVGCLLSSSAMRNQTNSVYDIFPSLWAAPRVTAPENMRSIILVEMAIEVRKSSRTSSSGTKTHEEKGNH